MIKFSLIMTVYQFVFKNNFILDYSAKQIGNFSENRISQAIINKFNVNFSVEFNTNSYHFFLKKR